MSAPADSYTNSSLSAARRCRREYELRYNQRLELAGEDREALQVGQCWHRAFYVQQQGGDPYAAIAEHAPSRLWAMKLARLFAAYAWRWQGEPIAVMESEHTFRFTFNGRVYEGQLDGRLKTADGRRGILERKTTAESLEPTSLYWSKLTLDVQTGLYGISEQRPDFILYDVVRKPTINPKALTKDEVARMRRELDERGVAVYFKEQFTADDLAEPLALKHESALLYGSRLTADIGDRPAHYFARRPVDRTNGDYDALLEDLDQQVQTIEHAERVQHWPRNPDACNAFGTCVFFGLCSNNVHPRRGDAPPAGFQRRQHVHPELVRA